MARYYFHLRDGVDLILDSEGRELKSVAAIAPIALRDARSILSGDALAGRLQLDQRIDVEDAAHNIVHSLEFSDAIEIIPRRLERPGSGAA